MAEIGRVLAPGGCFVHLMDMATLLEAPFAKLAASGLVPIPNVFGDPGDHEWPLDIVLVKRDWLDGLFGLAAGVGSPLSAELGGYCRAFFAMPFDTNAATKTFKAVASSGEKRHALLTLHPRLILDDADAKRVSSPSQNAGADERGRFAGQEARPDARDAGRTVRREPEARRRRHCRRLLQEPDLPHRQADEEG